MKIFNINNENKNLGNSIEMLTPLQNIARRIKDLFRQNLPLTDKEFSKISIVVNKMDRYISFQDDLGFPQIDS